MTTSGGSSATGAEQSWLTRHDLEQMLSTAIAELRLARLQPPQSEGDAGDTLEVHLTLHTGKQVRLIAKLFPAWGNNTIADTGSAGRLRSSRALRREIDFYLSAAPECRRLQEERGVRTRDRLDVLCACAAARATPLAADDDEGGGLAGEGSALLLEDPRTQGFVPGASVDGLGLEDAAFVVARLARFHAVAVGLKLAKPLVFRNKVVNALGPRGPATADGTAPKAEDALEVLRRRGGSDDHAERIAKLLDDDPAGRSGLPAGPFATVVHNDCRKANMLFKYDRPECGVAKVMGFKIVNFGNACYGTPVSDLILFLFTSTKNGVALKHLDSLLRVYYDAFVESLDKMKCHAQTFSFEKFTKELETSAAYELPRIVSCLFPSNNGRKTTKTSSAETLEDDFVQTTLQILKLFNDKGWL